MTNFPGAGTEKTNLLKNDSLRAIQNVDEFFFIGTDLEKCPITVLAQHWIPCGEWVPSE